MEVNGLSSYNYVSSANDTAEAQKKAAETAAEETTVGKTAKESETYKPDMDKINAMKADLSNNMLAFKQMVFSLFKTQGGYADSAMGKLLEIDEKTQLEAQEAISEDGYWGVNKTADRIVEFAKALAGGDPSKAEELQNAVLAGFEAAEKIWGGKLPEISYQTLEKVKESFKQWTNPTETE